MTKITIRNLTPEWERAAARAAEHYAAGSRAVALDDRHYAIRSSRDDATYTVRVESVSRLEAQCDCPAGSHGRVCYHMALAIESAAERIRLFTADRPAPQPAPVAARPTAAEAEAFMRRMAAA